jgi:hypothetical protein
MTSPLMDVRYSDTDVRTYPELQNVALVYALNYQGDFPFMVNAKLMAASGSLSIAVARGVLNCMRADPMAFRLLPRAPIDLSPRPTLRAVPPKGIPRPITIRPKVTWHKRYVLSIASVAFLAHYLDPRRSELRYHTYDGSWTAWIYPKCGARLSLVLMTDDPGVREVCRRCIAKEADE